MQTVFCLLFISYAQPFMLHTIFLIFFLLSLKQRKGPKRRWVTVTENGKCFKQANQKQKKHKTDTRKKNKEQPETWDSRTYNMRNQLHTDNRETAGGLKRHQDTSTAQDTRGHLISIDSTERVTTWGERRGLGWPQTSTIRVGTGDGDREGTGRDGTRHWCFKIKQETQHKPWQFHTEYNGKTTEDVADVYLYHHVFIIEINSFFYN